MTLNSIRNALFAAMHGLSVEQYELQKARDNLKSVTDDFLDQHPEYLRGRFAEGKPANGLELLKSSPVDTPTKVKRISKSLGADSRPVVSHTADHIDPEMLAKAKAAAAALAKSDPDRYGNIIKQQGV
ncbi:MULTISPECIES: hypothetical protein [Klebsiella pneumoniae complex]|uniref:hypothetical protein n=1 Tax=Klebsiella pneumoniae complex TaxID=3390273 RepID=UPI0010848AC1|nr:MULTISPECIES: hypothetical protein [Klebsiella]MDE1587650.1 hypothetical protein [Klebsiella quasipneumoniae]MDE1594780.1 hypothetical protein [Klebsiella quasipneumoniae]MDE1603614.1 hypothetical protein [Klebsiella quasipneumoniae]MDE1605488.1 hypothetical protein [Klebsiella quasipneumoniae]MDE1614355.1 hypothetical protein [Klebsiella quasipneumoniae]